MKSPREKRKTLLVLAAPQRKIVRHIAVAPVLGFTLILVAAVVQVSAASESAIQGVPAICGWTAIAGAFVWWILRRALVLSNRIAGPLGRMNQLFECVGKGDFTVRMQPRDDDVFMESGIEFNRMMDMLSKRCTYREPPPVAASKPPRNDAELESAPSPRSPVALSARLKGVVSLPALED